MVIKENIWYGPASEPRTLHIYLPDSYDASNERYPVMYFWDGHNLYFDSDATYGKSWGLREFLDGWDKEMIVVGVECSHDGNHRLDEYCPYDGRLMDYNIHGEGQQTMDWMTNVLKPYIDVKFRTYREREATAIGGSSMGGLMSLYAVTAYNSVYSKAACVSSTLFMVRDQIIRDVTGSAIDPDTRVYLSWGSKEVGGAESDFGKYVSRINRDVQMILQEKGADSMIYCQPEGGHCEADWEKQIPGFMEYLWKGGSQAWPL